jgi:hypothetical protein
VVRTIVGSETHVPHGMSSIEMFKYVDVYPNGCRYEGSISQAGMIKWGWKEQHES